MNTSPVKWVVMVDRLNTLYKSTTVRLYSDAKRMTQNATRALFPYVFNSSRHLQMYDNIQEIINSRFIICSGALMFSFWGGLWIIDVTCTHECTPQSVTRDANY